MVCLGELHCNTSSVSILLYAQETCQMFWPAAEGGTMNVGSMKVILLQSTARSEFDTYRFTIQKPRSVSVTKQLTLHCVVN